MRFSWMVFALLALGCSEYDLKGDAAPPALLMAMETLLVTAATAGSVPLGHSMAASEAESAIWRLGCRCVCLHNLRLTGDGEHDARAEDETDVNGAYELTGFQSTATTVYAIKGL